MNQDHREISNPDSVADRECLFSERVRFRDTAINTPCTQHDESPLTPDLYLREFLDSAERSKNTPKKQLFGNRQLFPDHSFDRNNSRDRTTGERTTQTYIASCSGRNDDVSKMIDVDVINHVSGGKGKYTVTGNKSSTRSIDTQAFRDD